MTICYFCQKITFSRPCSYCFPPALEIDEIYTDENKSNGIIHIQKQWFVDRINIGVSNSLMSGTVNILPEKLEEYKSQNMKEYTLDTSYKSKGSLNKFILIPRLLWHLFGYSISK